jgi:hypothetical protein
MDFGLMVWIIKSEHEPLGRSQLPEAMDMVTNHDWGASPKPHQGMAQKPPLHRTARSLSLGQCSLAPQRRRLDS